MLNSDHAADVHPFGAEGIALACGFASLGHFAQRYRERFGELPSATLARSDRHAPD